MNKVLIISDSHGLTTELTDIKSRHPDVHMIHCGDSELDIDAPELEGFVKVGGNCDFDSRYPQEETVEINGLRFFIAHGHLHRVKSGLMTIAYRAMEENADVVCFGHTHIAGAEKSGNLLLINPGSIRLPRIRNMKTYAILEWDTPEHVSVHFYTLDGEAVEEISIKTSLDRT
ncbi:metallophosphoesterase [Virgibacillus siamensis]|uniref:metallophosphoesterase n=1 Tax=Virgibacillus siamensis TaxID=480071 RepID=UPI00098535A9|nr:metallophosphoesterase [Virgibacillus siamensis]